MTQPATGSRSTPLSIMPAAPGWRAAVDVDEAAAKILNVTDGTWVVAVAMWAVVHRELVDAETGKTVVEDLGTSVEAMVPFPDGAGLQFVCAPDMGRSRYVAPDVGLTA